MLKLCHRALNKRIVVTIIEFGTGTAGAEGDKGSDP